MLEAILSIIIFIMDIIAIGDILMDSRNTKIKILWILIVLLLPILGIILYYSIGKEIPTITEEK